VSKNYHVHSFYGFAVILYLILRGRRVFTYSREFMTVKTKEEEGENVTEGLNGNKKE
jgi:hypothetical protein